SCNPLTLSIDGGTSSTKQQGGTFVTSGSHYTPNSAVTRYMRNPDGSTITLTPTLPTDSSGNISWSWTSTCSSAVATSTIWLVDPVKGQGPSVTQTVTANPSCNPSVGPDFIISDLYIKVGSTVYRAGGTIGKDSYVHPYCTVKNIGNSGTHPSFRLAYYINADNYRDSDGLDPNELCVGCSKTENVSSDSIKLGDTGTRTYRCCADYQSAVSELNESNNCATMTFTVK
ncbi:MAG: CARDB domain-containing protein, partial [Thermodesulfovibrionales bacterium]